MGYMPGFGTMPIPAIAMAAASSALPGTLAGSIAGLGSTNTLFSASSGGNPSSSSGSTTSGRAGGRIYDVGTYNQLRYTSMKSTIIHHVLSRLRGSELLADFAADEMAGTEFGIRLPESEANAVDAAALLWPEIPASARQTLAWQIRDLRNFTDAPNSSLQELVELSASKRKWDFNVRGN